MVAGRSVSSLVRDAMVTTARYPAGGLFPRTTRWTQAGRAVSANALLWDRDSSNAMRRGASDRTRTHVGTNRSFTGKRRSISGARSLWRAHPPWLHEPGTRRDRTS